MNAVRLVARREFTERVHERSFLISTGLTLAIIVVVVALPSLLGFGDPSEYRSPSPTRPAEPSPSAPPRSTSASTPWCWSPTTTRT